MAQLAIDIKGLTKRYNGFVAINDVTFSAHKGEVVGFVGLNGAGKSTTINLMLGFLRASAGTVTLLGESVTPETASRSHERIGYASGDMSLFDNLTGRQYLAFVSHRFNGDHATRLTQLVTKFDPDLRKKINELSRGNRQKIALIAAFMTSPELVILDEPSSGLDPLMQQVFIELIREESAKGTTIFMSSHYLNEVIDVCSRVILIKSGKLVKDVPASDLSRGGGKMVHIITHAKLLAPKAAEHVEYHRTDQGYELSFIYKAKPAILQHWLSGIMGLSDLSITDHDIEAAFDDLYELETGTVHE